MMDLTRRISTPMKKLGYALFALVTFPLLWLGFVAVCLYANAPRIIIRWLHNLAVGGEEMWKEMWRNL